MVLKIFALLLPWSIRRKLLIYFFKYEIHEDARIGLSWVYPKKMILGKGASIGNFTTVIHLDLLQLGNYSSIGRGNWITGFPKDSYSSHFTHQTDRKPELIIGEHTSITKNHHIDCTNTIKIGDFSTIAGYNSQFLTHSIDLYQSRQDSYPISIGDYCFVGTNVVVLGNSSLPSYSVLGAKSLLNKSFEESWYLYGGVPAKKITEISKDSKYFFRDIGYVY